MPSHLSALASRLAVLAMVLWLVAQAAALMMGAGPFRWRPFHEVSWVRLDVVTHQGQRLQARPALTRYGIPTWHFSEAIGSLLYLNELSLLMGAVSEFESRQAIRAHVTLTASTNGSASRQWALACAEACHWEPLQ